MRWIVLLLLPVVLLLAAACEEEDETNGTPTATVVAEDDEGAEAPEATEPAEPGVSYSDDDPEYKLASIDAGEPLSLDDPSIDLFARLLDDLDAKCEEERSLIGDQAVRATQLLADEGISVTILEALRGINGSIPEESPILNCAEIGALWITLIVNQ